MGATGLRLRAMVTVTLCVLAAGCATTAPKRSVELVWPTPPESPRVKYVESYSRRGHFGARGTERMKAALLGEDRQSQERMLKPFAVTTDDTGTVYVTDTGLGQVWVFDNVRRQVRVLGDSGPNRLATPSGIAVDERGVVFVSDTKLARVLAFDARGDVILAIGAKDEFYSPAGLAIDRKSGRLYVADAGRHRIRVYDRVSGKFLFEFGRRGTEPGQFNYPTHLFLRGDRLYVADTMNFRVQAMDLDGRPLARIGAMGANLGELARPKGVAVDTEGHVYVVDAAFNNFQIFDADGQLLLFVGRVGTQNGEFWLPAGMHIDDDNRIYVVDQYNRRVQVFQYLDTRALAKSRSDSAKK
jgi:DNA-binding beta-propeller fold protein YncE